MENLIYRGTADATLTGNALNNRITGGAGNDSIIGGAGNDSISGGAGNDSIDGGIGADTMIGGAGNDTYTMDNLGDVVIEAAGGGNDKIIVSLINTGAVLTVDLNKASSPGVIGVPNVENVTIAGTGLYNINGNAADNVLVGNGSNNVISGGAGNDFIDGGAGADTMTGGTGNDTYVVSAGNGAIGGADVVNELANGGRDVVVLALNASAYTLPAFVEDLLGTVTNSAGLTFSGNAVDNAIDLTLANGGTINPGLGANDSVTVRGFASGALTVTDPDGTDFVDIVLSNVNGTGTITALNGVDDVRFHLLSGSLSTLTANLAANASVLVSGAGSLGLSSAVPGALFSNAYTLSDFTGTLTFGATGTLNTDVLALKLLDVQGGLATTNTAIDRIALDSEGVVANSLAVGGVSFPVTSHPGFSVTGETALDLTAIGNSGFDVGLAGFTGVHLGLAALTVGSVQDWTVRTDGSATELAITAGNDANVLAVNTTGTGGESVLSITGASASGTINLAGNQGLTLLGIAGGTVNSTMDGTGVVLRLGFDGATNFNIVSGKVDVNVTGSAGADHFGFGTSLDSNDVVDGGAGADSLTATLAATTGSATVVVAPTISSVESIALNVLGNYVLDAMAMDASDVTVTGGGSNNGGTFAFSFDVQNGRGTWDASGYNANNSFKFTAAADANGVTVTGGAGIGTIVGSAGNDVINPGSGTGGSVTGGDGSDTFVFSKVPLGLAAPTVTDYTVGVDHIQLQHAAMAAIGSPGALDPSLFSTFTSADVAPQTQAGVLKYNTSDGTLYYDADGSGAGQIKDIGIFLKPDGTPAALTAADITVI